MDRWAILQHPRCSSWTESCSSSERSRLVDDVWRTEVKTAMYRALYSDSDLLKRSEECTGSRAVTATWLPENEPAEWTTPGQRRGATCTMDGSSRRMSDQPKRSCHSYTARPSSQEGTPILVQPVSFYLNAMRCPKEGLQQSTRHPKVLKPQQP